jgi:nitrate/TMAO reductase-like tetraheme cytochrome c subunit
VKRPDGRWTDNPLSSVGALITTVSAVLFLLFFGLDLFGLHANPYLGIVFFLVLPGFFVLGLLLIPAGLWRERRRRLRGLPPSQWHWPQVDINNPAQRRIVGAIAVLTVVNVVIVSLAAYKGIEYMDSVDFCGRVCHTVMEPEFVAYQDGPHARVKCIECHIGPGAPWFVKSKIDGIRQVWAVTFDTYTRPIPTPVHSLRPARDTCEHCHWPEKFTGDFVRTIPAYGDDEANTPAPTTLQVRVGGGGWRFGGPQGIHWHTSPDHRVEYIASDESRGTIPYVRLTDASGQVTEFVAEGTPQEVLRAGELRTMDCVDCHNRPSHRFAPSPERAVDAALFQGALPADLPYLRREAVAVLQQAFATRDEAEAAIRTHLEGFYAQAYPDLVRTGDSRLGQAVTGTQRLYAHNVFPKMQLGWGTHPDHIGHTDSPGCFRCHDEEHKAPDGRVIRQDCELCHSIRE